MHVKENQRKGYMPDDRYLFMKSFMRETISQKVRSSESLHKNSSVLPSSLTRLVNVFYDEAHLNMLTVDSDGLIRVWSMDTGECNLSYSIEVKTDEHKKRKLTSCSVDKECKHIVVSYESGIV